ncbi:Thrombospondin type 1 repeat-containing protein [Mactra antiquata]
MRKYSNDGFMALPTSALGMEYMAVSYYPCRSKTQFLVVATEDDTNIQFTMPYNDDVELVYGREEYSYRETFSEQLNRLGTLHLQARRGDVSGTYIKADKPIAVFSGNEETYVLPGKTYDFMVEQLPPVSSWGKTFAFVSTPERTDGDVYKFVAHDNDTDVSVSCTGGYQSTFSLNEAGYETIDTLAEGVCYAKASKAVMLVQFIKSATDKRKYDAFYITDPSMVVIYPTEQFGSAYSFTTAVTTNSKCIYQPYITVVADELEVDGLLLDGEPLVNYVDFVAVPNSNLVGTYINVTEGTHMLKHENPLSNFGGYIYGSGDKASYAMPLGSRVSPINNVCTPSTPELGDGIDNDCDGKIDEEFCDPYTSGEDDDGDGAVDEDCVQIDGTWAEWGAWGECSATCSNGYKTRERVCNDESPQGIGMYCWGEHDETDICDTGIECPSAPDNRGREFILGFMENRRSRTEVELFITTSRVYDVEVRVTSPKHFDKKGVMVVDEKFTVTSGYIHNLELDPDMASEGTEFASKGIHIEADDEIVVYGTNLEKYSNDGFLGLPVDVLGTEYYTVVYTPSNDDNEFLIVATEDDTEVEIHLPDDDDIKVDVKKDVFSGGNDRRKRSASSSDSDSDKSGSKSGSKKSGSKSGSDKSGSKSGSKKSASKVSKAKSVKSISATSAPKIASVKSVKSKSGSDKSGSKSGSSSGSVKSGSKVSKVKSVKSISATSAPKVASVKSVKSDKSGSSSGSDKSGSKSGSGKSGSKVSKVKSVKSISATSAPKVASVKSVKSQSDSDKSGSKSGSGKSGSKSGSVKSGSKVSKVKSVKSISATSAPKVASVKSVKSQSDSDKSGSKSGSGKSGSNSGSGKSGSNVSKVKSVKSISATSAPKVASVKSVKSQSDSDKSGSKSGSGKSGSKSGSVKSGSNVSKVKSVKSISATSAPKVSSIKSVKSQSGSDKSRSKSGSGKSGSKSGSGKSGSKSGSDKSGSKMDSEEDDNVIKMNVAKGDYSAEDTINLRMDKFDTFQAQTRRGDLTGAYITSNKPIAVFSGNVRGYVLPKKTWDHLVEQLLPVKSWGKTFAIVPTPERTKTGDTIRIVAGVDDTNVYVYCSRGVTSQHFNLDAGNYEQFDIESEGRCFVYATEGIMVAMFVKSETNSREPADPSMILIPPIGQYGAAYSFTTPKNFHKRRDYQNYFTFVVKEDEKDGLLLDGEPFPDDTIYLPVPESELVGGFVKISDGAHIVAHKSPIVTFGAILYGASRRESYGMPLGLRLADINVPCVPSTMEVADGINNDCDDYIDEELCGNGIDDDGDGIEDEDCAPAPEVNGNWTVWQEWSECSEECGDRTVVGERTRIRECTNPPPSANGLRCVGDGTETEDCYPTTLCTVDGNWGQWEEWTACSVSCESGTRQRYRNCDDPEPYGDGNDCVGDDTETENCDTQITCPIHGQFSAWSLWSSCSASCGIGDQSRERLCDDPMPRFGGRNCSGSTIEYQQCDVGLCPVDGVFSSWSRWTSCSVTCGTGTRDRSRSCDSPPPMNGGKDCSGDTDETGTCDESPCPIDGDYSDWTQWTSCSVTCGTGVSSRERYCDNPAPQHGGALCVGDDAESKSCDSGTICPVDGGFTDWSAWTACSVTCGTGTKDRSRSCDNPQPQYGGLNCSGDYDETLACDEGLCPVDGDFSDWTQWGPCSVTCGTGITQRERLCDNPEPQNGGANCVGDFTETTSCDSGSQCLVAVDGGFTDWSTWTACSVTCGTGTKDRSRSCDNPAPQNGGLDCSGDTDETTTCDEGACPVDGGFTDWSTWTSCSVTCGTGTKDRSRSCDNPAPQNGGLDCSGDTDETIACDEIACPIDGGYSDWTQWGPCSVTCGTGVSFRERSCDNPVPQNGGASCVGDDTESQSCDSGTVCQGPVDGGFTAWSSWTTCSVTCGTGTKDRSRSCDNPAPQNGGLDCSGDPNETTSCDEGSCPVDGGFTAWSSWTACSVTCGTGTKDRSRTCDNPAPQNGGLDCSGDTDETTTCDEAACPVDGGYSDWTQWGPCSVTCGTGVSFRERSCDNPAPQNGGASCVGDDTESQSCDSGTVCQGPVDGGFTAWSTWTACSVTCGTGTKDRSRSCDNPAPQNGGLDCSGDTDETTTCDEAACPVDGGYSDWTQWGPCSVTCGTGVSFRERSCDNPAPQNGGASCVGDDTESQSCDSGTVCQGPVDGGFTAWSTWTACSVTCGTGTKDRSRSCDNPVPQNGGLDCSGDTDETTTCDEVSCPVDGGYSDWTQWGPCSVTCGTGVSFRERSCDNPAPQNGGASCVGDDTESQSCDSGTVCQGPVDGGFTAWTTWTACSVTCGTGTKDRSRSCNNPAPQNGGLDCNGDTDETTTCDEGSCPVDGGYSDWTQWGPCSVTCGTGVSFRERSCDNPAPQNGGASCVGDDTESQSCDSGTVCQGPVDGGFSSWTTWSTCSVTCGTGTSTRSRSCNNPAPQNGGSNCVGSSSESTSCDAGTCSSAADVDGNWGSWASWIPCTKTCGGGITMRTRECNNPEPSGNGQFCEGVSFEAGTCNTDTCPSPYGSEAGSYVSKCPMGFFTCKSGSISCIQEIFRCDCMNDCDDGSDEIESWGGCTADIIQMCENSATSIGTWKGLFLVLLVVHMLAKIFKN